MFTPRTAVTSRRDLAFARTAHTCLAPPLGRRATGSDGHFACSPEAERPLAASTALQFTS
jgi:hypothetical protein